MSRFLLQVYASLRILVATDQTRRNKQRVRTLEMDVRFLLQIVLLAVEFLVTGRGRFVAVVFPQRAGDHQIGTVPVTRDGDVVHTALPQQHHDICLVRLRVEVVDQENGKVNLLAHHHGGNLGIAAHGPRGHNREIGGDPLFIECISHQSAGSTGANKAVLRQEVGVKDYPIHHVGLTMIVRYQRDG